MALTCDKNFHNYHRAGMCGHLNAPFGSWCYGCLNSNKDFRRTGRYVVLGDNCYEGKTLGLGGVGSKGTHRTISPHRTLYNICFGTFSILWLTRVGSSMLD